MLATAFAPSSALTYGLVAKAHIKDLREDPHSKEALLFLKKAAAEATTKKATPITPAEVRTAIESSPRRVANTIKLLWISAARHADLKAGKLVLSDGGKKFTTVVLHFGPWKSDRTGSRQATKALPVDKGILELLTTRSYASYEEVAKFLARVNPSLTVHSIRRGAITFLGQTHSPEDIAVLTQHAAGQSRSGAHRYLPPTANGPMASLQLRLACMLWSSLSSTNCRQVAQGHPETPTGDSSTTKERSRLSSKGARVPTRNPDARSL